MKLIVNILILLFYDTSDEREALFGAGIKLILIPVLVLVGIAVAIKVFLSIRDIRRENKKQKEKGEDPRWRRWE